MENRFLSVEGEKKKLNVDFIVHWSTWGELSQLVLILSFSCLGAVYCKPPRET